MEDAQYKEILSRLTQLKDYSSQFMNELAQKSNAVELETGEVLIRQGETTDSIYVVVEGRLRAVVEKPGQKPRKLGEIGRGEIVGEMAALTGEARSATVRAVRKTKVARLTGRQFMQLLNSRPEEAMSILKLISRRSKNMYSVSAKLASVALVPVSPHVDMHEFAKDLTTWLRTYRNCLLLTSARVNSENPANLLDWITSLESDHPLTIYVADPEVNDWTLFCMQQADRVMLVGNAGADPKPGPLERMLFGPDQVVTAARKELVLLHNDRNKRPTGTKAWLDARDVELHHHLGLKHSPDYARLARFITGNALCMVMSGGGAKAFANFGVLRAFREANIPIDMIGGASAGGMTAASYAMEWDHLKVLGYLHELAAGASGQRDWTLPVLSLFSGKSSTKLAHAYAGNWQIEDLWINYFCISTNLSTAHTVIHREGPLWKAIRASTAIPGLLPPLMENGECLIDGGVINNLPVDIMSSFSAGKIVAVDTTSKTSFTYGENLAPAVSGWKLFFQKLNPFAQKQAAPNIIDIISRASEVAALHLQRDIVANHRVDLMLCPPVDEFGFMDYKKHEKIAEASYRYAIEHAEDWKKELGIEGN